MRFMFADVFSCTTISTLAGKNSLLPTWSPCVCVLMMWVTGLSVTVFTLSMIAWPQFASLVSTRTTPLAVMKAAVLPPPPVIMNRLSFTFSIPATFGPAGACCSAANGAAAMARVPARVTMPSASARVMLRLLCRTTDPRTNRCPQG